MSYFSFGYIIGETIKQKKDPVQLMSLVVVFTIECTWVLQPTEIAAHPLEMMLLSCGDTASTSCQVG